MCRLAAEQGYRSIERPVEANVRIYESLREQLRRYRTVVSTALR